MKLKIKKWGNSLGAVLPKEMIKKKGLKEGSTVEVLVPENRKVDINKLFGSFKFKKSAQQMKDEMREAW